MAHPLVQALEMLKMKVAPDMCMKTKGRLTILPIFWRPLRPFLHGFYSFLHRNRLTRQFEALKFPIPADRPEPSESLRASTVWAKGIDGARHLRPAAQLDPFRRGLEIQEEKLIRGRRGAYFIQARPW